MLNRFSVTNECDRRTDRHQTHSQHAKKTLTN